MQQVNVGAIGKFVLWGKENLCLIRPLGEALALETLYYAEDLRSKAEIDEAVEETKLEKAELEMALQLVESLVGEWDPNEFENEYRRELRAMLEAKLEGREIARPEPVAPAPVIDLIDALKQSVAQAQGTKKQASKPKRASGGSRKRAASRG
jgi:DNA end-binding protein Ku